MPVVHCPSCSQALTVADGLGGSVVTCPACQKPMTLPAMPAATPVVESPPAFDDPFAVDDRPVRRERQPAPARTGGPNWTLVAIGGGAAAVLGMVAVGVVVWMIAGRSPTGPTTKDKQPEAKKPKVVKLSDAELDKANLPVSEDFELKARAGIDEKNLEKQLETLEKQINADTK